MSAVSQDTSLSSARSRSSWRFETQINLYRARLGNARPLLSRACVNPKLTDVEATGHWLVLDDAFNVVKQALDTASEFAQFDRHLVDEAVAFAREYIQMRPSGRSDLQAALRRFEERGKRPPASLVRLMNDLAGIPYKSRARDPDAERRRWIGLSKLMDDHVHANDKPTDNPRRSLATRKMIEDAAVHMQEELSKGAPGKGNRNRNGTSSESILRHYKTWLKLYNI